MAAFSTNTPIPNTQRNVAGTMKKHDWRETTAEGETQLFRATVQTTDLEDDGLVAAAGDPERADARGRVASEAEDQRRLLGPPERVGAQEAAVGGEGLALQTRAGEHHDVHLDPAAGVRQPDLDAVGRDPDLGGAVAAVAERSQPGALELTGADEAASAVVVVEAVGLFLDFLDDIGAAVKRQVS